jgi:hypothetical protein
MSVAGPILAIGEGRGAHHLESALARAKATCNRSNCSHDPGNRSR